MALTNPQVALLAAAIMTIGSKSPLSVRSVMSAGNNYLDWLERYDNA